jgi:hypothetical protein
MQNFLNYSAQMQNTIARQMKAQANGVSSDEDWLGVLKYLNPEIPKPYPNYPADLVGEIARLAEKPVMKRYVWFSYDGIYPHGGSADVIATADKLEELPGLVQHRDHLKELDEILDLDTRTWLGEAQVNTVVEIAQRRFN